MLANFKFLVLSSTYYPRPRPLQSISSSQRCQITALMLYHSHNQLVSGAHFNPWVKRVHKKNKVRIKLLVQGCNATAIAISDWNPGLLTAPTPLQENAKLKKFTRRRTDRSLTKFDQKSSLELSTQKRIIFEPLLKNQNSFCLTTRYKLIFFICLLNVRVQDFEKHQIWRLIEPKATSVLQNNAFKQNPKFDLCWQWILFIP